MRTYREQFPGRTLFAVIHATTLEQVLRNIFIARDASVDGVFLINHQVPWSLLWDIYHKVRGIYPLWFVGVNFLDLPTQTAIQNVPTSASALWVDDGGLATTALPAERYAKIRAGRTEWPGLYFGSVAFKYQKQSTFSPGEEASRAVPLMDVIVTSGPATGTPPDLTKIQAMRNAIGPDMPLAIASGITAGNVEQFLPLVDCFMVATGISDSHTELNAQKVRDLVRLVHQ